MKKTIINKSAKKEFENLSSNWTIGKNYHLDIFPNHEILIREYLFDSDEDTNQFVSTVLNLAKNENHHPLLIAEWHKVILSWSSHEKKEITDLDYIMAIKSDEIFQSMQKKDK